MNDMDSTYDLYFKDKVKAISALEQRIAVTPGDPYLMREYVNTSNILLFSVMGVVERLADAKEEAEAPVVASIFTVQRMIGDWSRKTFPASTTDSTTRHLWKEMAELDTAVERNKAEEVCEEVADVFILLVQLCNQMGISLEAAVREKHRENVGRAWDAPDKHGVVYHTKESN